MPGALCFFLLFLLPFVIAPFGVTEFEVPKVIFAEACIIFLFLLSLISKNNSFRVTSMQLYLYGAIFFITLLDLVFLRSPLSFFGNAFRMQGIFLLWLLMLFSLVSQSYTFKRVPWYVFGILLLSETVAIFFLPLNASQRFVGTLGEPNALAAFVIFLWPFAYFGIQGGTRTKRIALVLLLLLVAVILFLTDSKSAMVALLIQLSAIILAKKKMSAKKIVLICLALYLLSYLLPFFSHNTYENRVEVWRSALYVGFTHPQGVGFGNTEFALHNSAKLQGLPIQYYYVDSAHNIFLDWWVQGGIIGFLILFALVYLTSKKFVKMENFRELVLFLGMLIVLSFNPASIIGLLGFWWLIGQGLQGVD